MNHSVLVIGGMVLAALVTAQVPLDESGLSGYLAVRVLDSFGEPLTDAEISLRRSDENKQARISFASGPNIVGPLQYGTYTATVKASGYETVIQTITIHSSTATALFGLVPGEVSKVEGDGYVSGTIQLQGVENCDWLRLIPAFANTEKLDVKIADGRFQITRARPGKYIAVLLGQRGVCATTGVRIEFRRTQAIVIK